MFEPVRRAYAAFKTKPTAEPAIPKDEQAWSETSMYRASDFPKYNPDALIGRKGYAIYSKMMTDEQIKAVVRFKRDAITSRDWVFELDDAASLSEKEVEVRKAVFSKSIKNMESPFSDSLNGIMSAMYNGFSMTEKVLSTALVHDGKTYVGIKKLKLKPCDTFYFHTDEFGNVKKLTQKFDSKEQEVDMARMIHFVQNPDSDEHYGRSELRECYRAWFSKDMVIKFQNIHLERFAAGFVWATPVNGKTLVAGSQEYLSLQQVMNNLQGASSIILPSNIELHIEHPATTDAFEKAVSQHDKSMAKSLLVPNLMGISEQGSTGSYAQSQTQLEAFLWTLDADATRLEAALNAQLFKELGDLNFGDGIYPRFKFKPVSDTRKLEIVKLWVTLVTAGAVQATDVDEAFIREVLELPKKKEIEGDAPDLILNGAQVTALTGIVAQVGAGTLSPEAAKALITAVFPISEEQASAMVDSAKVEKPAPAAPSGDLPPVTGADGKPLTPEQEETIVGKMGITVSAFRKMFWNEDQPRDEAGRFGEVGGAAIKMDDAGNAHGVSGRVLRASSSRVGVVTTPMSSTYGTEFSNIRSDALDHLTEVAKERGVLQEVPIKSMLSAQGGVSVEHIRAVSGAELADKHPVAAIHANGKFILIDGNHRVSAAYLYGANTVPVRVLDVGRLNLTNHEAIVRSNRKLLDMSAQSSECSILETATKYAPAAPSGDLPPVTDADGKPLTPEQEETIVGKMGITVSAFRKMFWNEDQPRGEDGRWGEGGSTHSAEAVGFDKDPTDYAKYKNAPNLGRHIMDVADAKKLRAELAAQGRLNADGRTVSVYHVTLNDEETLSSIASRGLIPGASPAAGQDWKAAHSEYATYAHSDKAVALRDVESAGGFENAVIVEARIPITPKSMLRVLPDEDFSDNVLDGVKIFKEGGPIAYIGGVPNSAIKIHRAASFVNSRIQNSRSTTTAFSRAMKRVDFAVIANKADNSTKDAAYEIAALNSTAVARLVALAQELKLGTADGNPNDVQKIQYSASELSAIKTAVNKGLKEAWSIGESHAKREIQKAKGVGETFAVNDLALQDMAAAYIKQKSYTLAGDISAATQKVIRNILMEGVKASKTAAETKRAIYKALEADGMLTEEAVVEALGASTVKQANARIETAIRTTSFEAINEARYSFFSDPALDGFVEALEYSAILDDRTTEVCSQLNGETFGIDSEVWSTFRPPNHFNCRSILIPVTVRDTWVQSGDPSVLPQKGFGFERNCKH